MTSGVDTFSSQHVMCVVGADLDLDKCAEIVAEVGGPGFDLDADYSQRDPDPRMAEAFEVSADLVVPSFTDEDRAAVADHQSVAYILGPSAASYEGFAVTRRMLAVVAALLQNGGTAAKSESSGIAHGRDRWLHLASVAAAATDRAGQAPPLYAAFVRRPLSSGLVYYSCGLHLMGEADVEITAADDDRGLEWMDGLARYLLIDRGSARIRDGDTFGLQADSPRRVLRHRACTRYRDDDLFYNPWGYWRLAV
ncbi:hypothetical protein [Virgisporangium aurantiacum]|uniref:DUF4261 domain-containing protein n=1 Tax=Virgisporangium aurantiacum TaxID=175570 RepID=A0A8J3ZHJ9_9ACTN|nr:hypothetical protein [Virgisporangium aurantiacum]GIJ62943.1 hypothetical protein Vau01_104590 [Virgisporangium aurantiacum]